MKIPPLNTFKLLSIAICFTMLAGCSSNSTLVSAFSQRKYTKGYFADAAGQKPSVIGIKANKTEDKRAVFGIQKNNIVNNIKVYRNSQKAIQSSKQIPSLEGLRDGFPIRTKETNTGLSAAEQTKATHSETSTSGDTGDDTQPKKTAIVLFAIAALCLVLGLINFAGLVTVFILAAIVLAILGIINLYNHSPQHTDRPVDPNDKFSRSDPIQQYTNSKGYDSHVGLAGLLMVIGGLLIDTVAGVLLLLIAFGGSYASILVIAIVASVVSLALLVVGVILCINAVTGNDKYYGCAMAGLIIVGIIVAAAILGVILRL